jgi:hypothetical protein
MPRSIVVTAVALTLFCLGAILPDQGSALSNTRWELHNGQNATGAGSGSFASVQNRNKFVVLAVGWNETAKEYVIALHSDNLINRAQDIRFQIDSRDPIVFQGSRDWMKREYSVHNHGKSIIIGSPYSQDADSLKERKLSLVERLQSGQTAVVRYDEVVYGQRTVRFTLKDSRDTISTLNSEQTEQQATD